MIKDETIHIRVNSAVKDGAEAALEALGVSISEAINIFLCQVDLVGGIPFEVKLPAPKRVIVKNEDELIAKLNASREDIEEGRISSADEVNSRLEAKYAL